MKDFIGFLPHPPAFSFDWEGLMKSNAGTLLKTLSETKQNPEWHAEGDVLSHTKLVCEYLCGMQEFRLLHERERAALSLAALFHDIGIIQTTTVENGVIRSFGHSAAGAKMAREFMWKELSLCGKRDQACLRECVCLLIENHMPPTRICEKKNAEERLRKLSVKGKLMPPFSLRLLCMLSLSDVCGRIAPDTNELSQAVRMGRELMEETGCPDGCAEFPDDYTERMYFKGANIWPGMADYADTWGEVLLLSGLPGTGKDTWLKENHPALLVVSMDALRESMGVSPTDEQGRVVQTAKEQARKYLRAKAPFAWNATNITSETRAKLVKPFEDYGARVRIIYLETEWRENLSRNAGRKACVPELVIERMLSKLTPPMQGMTAETKEEALGFLTCLLRPTPAQGSCMKAFMPIVRMNTQEAGSPHQIPCSRSLLKC